MLLVGCAIEHRSKNQARAKEAGKFGYDTGPGIFMGYEFSSGRKRSGDYWVLGAESYANAGDGKRCPVLRVRETIPRRPGHWPVNDGSLDFEDNRNFAAARAEASDPTLSCQNLRIHAWRRGNPPLSTRVLRRTSECPTSGRCGGTSSCVTSISREKRTSTPLEAFESDPPHAP